MKKVIIESPYAGDIERNIKYARACLKDSLNRGEAPLVSHLLYTQEGVLDDTIKAERRQGIDAGLAWIEAADLHVFYIDYGMSKGMEYARGFAIGLGVKVEYRKIGKLYQYRKNNIGRTIAEEQYRKNNIGRTISEEQ